MCLGMACYIKSCVVRVSNRVLCGYRYENTDDHRERRLFDRGLFKRMFSHVIKLVITNSFLDECYSQ